MDVSPTGRILIVLGILILATGLFLVLGGRVPFLGKLPGDLRVERQGFSFYFPLMTCILLSAVLSFLLWIMSKR